MIGFDNDSVRGATLLLAALALTACPADDPPIVEDGSSGATDEGTTVGGPGPGTSGSGVIEDGTTTGDTLCGNDELDPGEACDDGNNADGDGCTASCELESCALGWTWSEPLLVGNPGAFATVVDGEANVLTVGSMEGADNDIWVAKWDPQGEQLWSQTIDSGNGIDVGQGIAVDDAGDLYIAARVAGDGDAMYYARLDGSDGSEIWSQTIDSMFVDADDIGIDVALTPDGDVVVAGRLRVGEGDDDAWLSRRSAADGSEVWATTWSGVGDGTFSTDRVNSLDIAADGTIWLAVREHVDFETQEAVLLGFDSGGMLITEVSPLADGSNHQHNPFEVAAYEGGVYFAFVHGSSPYRVWIYKYDNAGDEQWVLTQDDIQGEVGEDYRLRALDTDTEGTLLLGGDFVVEGGPGDHEWREAWITQLDPEAALLCRGSHMEDDGAPFAPVISVFSGGAGPGGGMALSGRVDEGAGVDSWLWTGYFVP